MNPDLEFLLTPVSETEPCGPDLGLDLRFEELENLLKGTPEVDYGSYTKPGEPPDWRALQKKTLEFLAESRHLRVLILMVTCQLKTRGIVGFRDGVQSLRSVLENFWPTIHPQLDPDDDNDPTRRLNQLSAINAPRGSVSGWLAIADYLHLAPLCRPPGTAGITYEEILKTQESSGSLTSETPIGKALLAAPAAEIVESEAALGEALEAVTGIDTFLTETLGAGGTIGFEDIKRLLQTMRKSLKPFLPTQAGSSDASDAIVDSAVSAGSETTSASGVGSPAHAFVIRGTIRTREEVVKALEAVCDYYAQVEPGSPVPFLLRRAQKMATMNFIELMAELSLATTDTLRPSMGSAVDSGVSTGA